jgi:hypothetical protein
VYAYRRLHCNVHCAHQLSRNTGVRDTGEDSCIVAPACVETRTKLHYNERVASHKLVFFSISGVTSACEHFTCLTECSSPAHKSVLQQDCRCASSVARSALGACAQQS